MATPEFHPTHVVPQGGLPAWEAPEVSRPTDPLDPLLPVQLLDRRGDWGQIVCANGWSAWVDGRLLVSVPQGPPSAGQPLARTADPRPLLARVEESLGQYRRAAQDLAAGRSDEESFRRRTQGLRVGMVVEGESVWLYDAEHERWVFCDGTRLTTYAASGGPGSASARPHSRADAPEPSRAAGPEAARVVVREAADQAPVGAAGPEPTQVVDPARVAEHGPADAAGNGATRLVKPLDGTGGAHGQDGHPPTRAGDR
ncbi:hypothetical protein [Streptomyces sp. H27-C3]|uniref:hypothetical protein n=1 Tax=Streptomyces sp. H27-C3 TaxID=3046305 RepID=UPI0024B8DD74|nr:hypothetical protein [Streptomyces sp. H27-C3]MDJ0465532.1 hypothetical protein [Streptomyces sp. H27-C3]